MSPRRLVLALLSVLAIVVAGAAAVDAAAAKPDFSLGVNPTSQSVQQGQQAVYTVTATGTGGFAGTVSFSASGLPSGATSSFSPSSVTLSSSATSASSTLTVTTTKSTPVGSYTITVNGTSGKTKHSITMSLTVNYALSSSFSISASPASVTVPSGSTAVYTVTITRTNFTGAVTLKVYGGLPGGSTPTFTPNPATGNSSTLQIATTAGTTPDGTYTLYLVGSGTIGSSTQYAYAQTQLVVDTQTGKPFTISGNLSGKLAPGVPPQPLDLTLSNPNKQALRVTNLTVTVSKTSAGTACDRGNFAVTQYSGPYPITLAKGQTASLSDLGIPSSAWPKVQMLDLPKNQDACKNVTITLAFSGAGQGD
jgi:hypothetical protein